MLAAHILSALLSATAVPAQAREAFSRGEKALQAGQLEEAASAYQQALRAWPSFAEALNGLGSVLFRQGKRAEAVTKFQAAISSEPGFKLAYFNLGYACRKEGDFARAAQAYERYVELDPTDPDAYFGLAESYRHQGQAEQALRAYETYLLLETRPSMQAWVDKANGYAAQLKAQLAERATPTSGALPALSVGRTAAGAIAEGDAALAEGHAAAAVQAYHRALVLDPSSVEALFKQGNALSKLLDYRAAIEKWERVVQLSPDAAVRRSAQENVDKARARLAQAAAAPAAAQARAREAYEKGVRLVLSRDYAAAVQVLTEALTADPTLAAAYTARGSANVGLRHLYEAAADYQDALRLDPTRASPLFGLAEAYRALGRASDARRYYERYAASTATDVQPVLQAAARDKSAALAAAGAEATAPTP